MLLVKNTVTTRTLSRFLLYVNIAFDVGDVSVLKHILLYVCYRFLASLVHCLCLSVAASSRCSVKSVFLVADVAVRWRCSYIVKYLY